jgi:hypothetical protein
MGLMNAVALGSSGNVTALVVQLVLLVLNFVAVSKIITKAGYSPKWILVPLTTVGLWVVTFILLVVDVRTEVVAGGTLSLPVTLSNFKVLQGLDLVSVVVTWILFLVFAFSDWPVATRRHDSVGPAGGRVAPVLTGHGAGPSRSAGPASAVAPPTGLAPSGAAAAAIASSATLVRDPAAAPAVIFCSWCGKERAVDAQAIHHCGSKDRPAVYCMHCGTPLGEAAATCASCGASTAQLSK